MVLFCALEDAKAQGLAVRIHMGGDAIGMRWVLTEKGQKAVREAEKRAETTRSPSTRAGGPGV